MKHVATVTGAGYSNSVWLGNAGEHLVVGKLLSLHFHAFVADRNNRAFDVAAYRDGKFSLLRVKTKTAGSAVWTRKKTGSRSLNVAPNGISL
jgi:hypothetical protein